MMRRSTGTMLCLLLVAGSAPVSAADGAEAVSPFNQIEPRVRVPDLARTPSGPEDVRRIDGSGNNLVDTELNATQTPLMRSVPSDYADDVDEMAGDERPNPRDISNTVSDQTESVPNQFGTSSFLWQWGQFVDHDIDLTEGMDPPELEPIAVPAGDPHFDPAGTGAVVIHFNRSLYDTSTGNAPENPRQQVNEITAWIDASNVYGSDPVRAAALRTLDGTGRLATSAGELLPTSDGSLPNATGGSHQPMFLAGDVRANEQLGLAALHTLFVREHNRWADEIREAHPGLSGDAIYERARLRVGALMQAITYQEFLPALLGPGALPRYRGYDSEVDPRIANEFSTAAYRFGHSALPTELERLDASLEETVEGHVPLRDAFFSPDRIRDVGGIEPVLRGLAHQLHQRIDVRIVDDVRNFLFGPPGAGGFDLAALNIQRGRDHGLCSYNDAREAYGFGRAKSFADISSDPAVQARLAAVYESVDEVDMWVGGLAEDPAPGSQLGRLMHTMVVEQFTALRDGDRFWYENALGPKLLREVRRTRLSDVIRRNSDIGREISDDVFRVIAPER